MKNVLFCLLFGLLALPGLAQDRIVLLRDTTRLNLSVAKLEKKYPPALARKPGEKGLFARQGKLFTDSLNAVYHHFFQYIETNKRRLPVLGLIIQTQEFIRPDGSYDRVFCEFSGMDLTNDQESQLLVLVAEWYGQNRFPLKTQTGFRWQNFMQLGSIPQKRIVRQGPGIISTLEAAQRTNRPDTVKTVLFGGLELEQVPEVIYRFANVEEISLGGNYLTSLPARLTTLPKLQRLDLMSNRLREDSVFFARNTVVKSINLQKNSLTHLPVSIRQNRRLESLWLGNNDLKTLNVKSLRRLPRLNDLNLYNTGLTQLPKTIGRLKQVKVLDLYYNKLTELPRQLGRMKQLEQLAIAHNDLTQLPASLAKLHRLQVLFAHHNRISQLPDAFQRLTNLHVLDLGYNWFTVAPRVLGSLPALEELDLNNNNLQEFPTVLTSIRNLKKVYLGSNPLFGREAVSSPYAPQIQQLEANKTEVFY